MKLIYVFLFILVLTIIHLYIQNNNQKLINEQLQEISEDLISEKISLTVHKINREYELLFNGRELSDKLALLDDKNQAVLLKDIVEKKKLIFRYSELHCNTCIDTEISNLKQLADSIGNENIIVFVTPVNQKYIIQFKKLNNIKFAIYKLSEDMEAQIPDIGLPYYFVLESDNFRLNASFVPQKEISELTNRYFNDIRSKYFIKE
ncbi:MAG: hypothetical protein ACK5KT_16400 [Dysgonomonas sp.]